MFVSAADRRVAQISECVAFAPSCTTVFFTSTKFPTCAPSRISAPGRKRANGPNVFACQAASGRDAMRLDRTPSSTRNRAKCCPCESAARADARLAEKLNAGSITVSGPTSLPDQSPPSPADKSSRPIHQFSSFARAENAVRIRQLRAYCIQEFRLRVGSHAPSTRSCRCAAERSRP